MAGRRAQINPVLQTSRESLHSLTSYSQCLPLLWGKSLADFADGTVAATRGAVFPSVKNHAQVQRVPAFGREEFF